MALVFANQGIGSVIAVFIGLLSVTIFPAEIAWRFMLAFGAMNNFRISGIVEDTDHIRCMTIIKRSAAIGNTTIKFLHIFYILLYNKILLH